MWFPLLTTLCTLSIASSPTPSLSLCRLSSLALSLTDSLSRPIPYSLVTLSFYRPTYLPIRMHTNAYSSVYMSIYPSRSLSLSISPLSLPDPTQSNPHPSPHARPLAALRFLASHQPRRPRKWSRTPYSRVVRTPYSRMVTYPAPACGHVPAARKARVAGHWHPGRHPSHDAAAPNAGRRWRACRARRLMDY